MNAPDELERPYAALVERISRYPLTEAVRSAILAEIAATYRREGAEQDGADRRRST
jgi:hypothetical protein